MAKRADKNPQDVRTTRQDCCRGDSADHDHPDGVQITCIMCKRDRPMFNAHLCHLWRVCMPSPILMDPLGTVDIGSNKVADKAILFCSRILCASSRQYNSYMCVRIVCAYHDGKPKCDHAKYGTATMDA